MSNLSVTIVLKAVDNLTGDEKIKLMDYLSQ